MITQQYNLDLVPNGPDVVVKCSQYDKESRTITFNMFDSSELFTIPSGATVTVRGTKADNTGFEYPCTYSGNAVSFNVKEQMTIFNGKVLCEIRITNGGEVLGTANFILFVERSALADDIAISETDLPLVQKAADAADELDSILEAVEKVTPLVPEGAGTTGQFLQKTATGTQWADVNSAVWGNITGTLSAQTDLKTELDKKVESVNNILPVNKNVTLKAKDIPFDTTNSWMTQTDVQSVLEYMSNYLFLDKGYKGGTTSIESGTAKELATLTAPADGTYLVGINCGFNSNANGYRVVTCNGGQGTYNINLGDSRPAVSGAKTSVSLMRLVGLSEGETCYAFAYQNSGSTINMQFQFSLILVERQ